MSELTQEQKEWKRIRVTNARAKLSVRVHEDDIAGAICSDHQNCVIARAIMRQHKASFVDVGANVVLIFKDKNHATRYRLAPLAQEQIRYFDTHNGVFAPCKLALSVPTRRPLHIGSYKKKDGAKRVRKADKRKPTR